jgi:hypothetical protein
MNLPHRSISWLGMVTACLIAGVSTLAPSQDSSFDYETLLRSQLKQAYGTQFTWDMEHHSLPAALEGVRRRYTERAHKPFPVKIDTSKPKVWYSKIVTSFLNQDALYSRIETSDDVGLQNSSILEWLCPGNQLCYSTVFQNKEVTVYNADKMPIHNIVAGMLGFLQKWVSSPMFKITPAPADLVLPEIARQNGAPQLRISLPDGPGGVYVWFDPSRHLRQVTFISDEQVASQWLVLTDQYVDGVWPEQVECTFFQNGKLQTQEWWRLKEVKKGAVTQVPAEPKLDGLKGMMDMTGPAPRWIPLGPGTPPPIILPK